MTEDCPDKKMPPEPIQDDAVVSPDLIAIEQRLETSSREYFENIAERSEAIKQVLMNLKTKQDDLKKYMDESKKTTVSLAKQVGSFVKYNSPLKKQDKDKIKSVKQKIAHVKHAQSQANVLMPNRPGWFLRQCIGNINISLYWDKYQYKSSYEKFKFKFNLIVFVYIMVNWLFLKYNIADYVTYAIGIWYYSSLIIQENILVENGSKIKIWWRVHHYLSVLSSLLMVLWPANASYQEIRNTQYVFMLVQCSVQVILFTYQHALSYKKRSLGSADVDIMKPTTDGLETENFAGFSFITIILTGLYIFHLYLAYCIRVIYTRYNCCWYVYLQFLIYLVFFICNFCTLFYIYISKSLRLFNLIRRNKS